MPKKKKNKTNKAMKVNKALSRRAKHDTPKSKGETEEINKIECIKVIEFLIMQTSTEDNGTACS